MMEKDIATKDSRKLARPAAYAGFLVILALLPLFFSSPYYLHIFILVFIYIISASSMRLVITSGQMPLAHAAFMGIGAYVAAIPSKWFGWPPWLTIPMGALVAMGIGIIIAFPFARLRAMYYAMVSLFFGTAVVQVVPVLGRWTGSYSGLSGIQPIFMTFSKIPYYYFFLGLTVLCLLALYRFEFCRIGTKWKAIDQSYLVAASVGINEGRYRIFVLAVGCFFAGLAGAVYAQYNLVVSPNSFNMLATLWLVMYVLVGGVGNFAGPIIGTTILFMVPEVFRVLKQYSPFISAGILLVVVFMLPQGLAGLPKLVWSKVKKNSKYEMGRHDS
jgi:branched-chain amino acid transport system permease protein